jgi:hypothetical protein
VADFYTLFSAPTCARLQLAAATPGGATCSAKLRYACSIDRSG